MLIYAGTYGSRATKGVDCRLPCLSVKVRVVRFREYVSDEHPPVVQRLDMVFLDEEVNLLCYINISLFAHTQLDT